MDVQDKRRAVAEKLRSFSSTAHCFLGFDGFTDEILEAVESRHSAENYTSFATIEQFSKRLQSYSHKSGNLEFVVKQIKIGGNAPIMAVALCALGEKVSLAANIGIDRVEPLFQPLAEGCEATFLLGSSAHSDAVEFTDGKIIFGKLSSIFHIDFPLIQKKIPNLQAILNDCTLTAFANWTMIPQMTEIWKQIAIAYLPTLKEKHRFLFIDLADPEKRSNADLLAAIEALSLFSSKFKVVLGLNQREGERLSQVILNRDASNDLLLLAKELRIQTKLYGIVIHAKTYAVASTRDEDASATGPDCPRIVLSTGGGDNFNAGFCKGLLMGLNLELALIAGVGCSGFYITQGKSPQTRDLAEYLEQWV